jgi:hypothetical protein
VLPENFSGWRWSRKRWIPVVTRCAVRRKELTNHNKEDHLTGHELSRQALEYSAKTFEHSQEAHEKSEKASGKKQAGTPKLME